MDEVEKELIGATGFKPKRDYPHRQDYLAALAREVNSLAEDDYEQLSNDAVSWFNAAAQALNDQDEIPDFDGTLPDAEDEEDPDDEVDALEEAAEPEPETDDEAPASEANVEAEEKPDPYSSPEEGDAGAASKPAKKTKKAKKQKAVEEIKHPGLQRKKPIRKLDHPEIVNLEGSMEIPLDRYGVAIGTKNAAAIAMLEKGCRMAEITENIGGTYYNIVRKLVKEGHRLEKQGNGTLTLTHKDDVSKAKRRK